MTYSQACWVCRDARFDSLVTLYAQLEAVISPGVHWLAAEAKLSGSIQIGVSKFTAAITMLCIQSMLSILQPKHMPLLCVTCRTADHLHTGGSCCQRRR